MIERGLTRIHTDPSLIFVHLRKSTKFGVPGICLLLALAYAAFAADPAELVHQAALGWMQGAVTQDGAALQRFMSDDLQYAHAGGQVQTKEQYIAAVTSGPPRYESFTLSDLKIRLYGPKAAVLTAYCDVKLVGQDNFRVRTLQVYVENNGQWQMAAHQSTRMGGCCTGSVRGTR